MLVKIFDCATGVAVDAYVRKAKAAEMPSMHNGWRFNFNKHAGKSGSRAYIIVTEDEPSVIQGALVFELKDKEVPYMSFVEVAPHNKGRNKKYDHVAGCLIGFAYLLSLTDGKYPYNGILFFDVMEKEPADTIKLMALYSQKYFAKRFDGTTMVIMDDDGQSLVNAYLPEK